MPEWFRLVLLYDLPALVYLVTLVWLIGKVLTWVTEAVYELLDATEEQEA